MQFFIEPELKLYKKDKVIDLSEFVQSMQVTKSLRNPGGSFYIMLNPTLGNSGRITLHTNRIYNEILAHFSLNDIIAGRIDRRSKRHSFLGLVSNPYESMTQINNQVSRSIVVQGGFALPKLLSKDMIVLAPEIETIPEIKNNPILKERAKFFAWTRGIKDKNVVFINSPQKIIEWILENAPATNIQILDGKSVKSLFPSQTSKLSGPNLITGEGAIDYLDKPMIDFKFLDGEFIFGEMLSTFSGPVMNYIYECLDKEFYECFFDTTTGKNGLPYNTMTIRTKPLSHKDLEGDNFFKNWTYWEDLPTVEIKSEDIFQREIGKSDYELKNFFRVNYDKVLLAQSLGRFGLNFPIFNANSITKHGLRALEVNSTILVDTQKIVDKHNELIAKGKAEYLATLMQGEINALTSTGLTPRGDGLIAGLLGKRNKIKEWFGFPYYESGFLRTNYNEEITIGRRINLPEYEYYFPLEEKSYKGIKLYVTDVFHNFQWGTFAETKANVTNGQADGVVKKYFDHPDNQFTISPTETKVYKPPLRSDPIEFFDSLKKINEDMLKYVELPND